MIWELHKQGLSVTAIAQRTCHDRKTVRKYIAGGAMAPKYTPRQAHVSLLAAHEPYLRQRLAEWPELTGTRLLRKIREQGYGGSYTILKELLRRIRPTRAPQFEVRFATAPGQQAQVDFAEFKVQFDGEPGVWRKVWLFATVLGHSRYLWAQFVLPQDLPALLRCHMQAFEHFGGVPRQILYDRMKTAEPEATRASRLVSGEPSSFTWPAAADPCTRCCSHRGGTCDMTTSTASRA